MEKNEEKSQSSWTGWATYVLEKLKELTASKNNIWTKISEIEKQLSTLEEKVNGIKDAKGEHKEMQDEINDLKIALSTAKTELKGQMRGWNILITAIVSVIITTATALIIRAVQ
jgi:chromosome segregation ATPase